MRVFNFVSRLFKKEEKKEEKFYIDHLELLKTIKSNFNNYKELETYLQLTLQSNTRKDMLDVNSMFVISETSTKEVMIQDFFVGLDIEKCLRDLKDYTFLLNEKIKNEDDTYIIRMTKISLIVIENILKYF